MQQGMASSTDAELILKLYELRTEAVMRQARAWVTVEFWPETAAEFFTVQDDFGSQKNCYVRVTKRGNPEVKRFQRCFYCQKLELS